MKVIAKRVAAKKISNHLLVIDLLPQRASKLYSQNQKNSQLLSQNRQLKSQHSLMIQMMKKKKRTSNSRGQVLRLLLQSQSQLLQHQSNLLQSNLSKQRRSQLQKILEERRACLILTQMRSTEPTKSIYNIVQFHKLRLILIHVVSSKLFISINIC